MRCALNASTVGLKASAFRMQAPVAVKPERDPAIAGDSPRLGASGE